LKKNAIKNIRRDLGEIQLSLELQFAAWQDQISLKQNTEQKRDIFSKVKNLCLFIGYPRSGHSLISSLIDAHPNALIGHRTDALQFFEKNEELHNVFYRLFRNSQRFAKKGRKLTRYQYYVPGQWQGKCQELHVIGDQEGRMTTERLEANPDLLSDLMGIQNLFVKFILVIRNPFDNISSWSIRTKRSLEFTSRRYLALCRTVRNIREQLDAEHLIEIHHEAFLNDPEIHLRQLCQYLGLETDCSYLNDCKSIVYQQPRQSRYQLEWSEEHIKYVEKEIKEFDFLQEYSFNA